MRLAWRTAVALAVFVAVGWVAARAVMAHAAKLAEPLAEVRLSGEAAGLFAGGLAAVVWRR
jgi:hypothetical protein